MARVDATTQQVTLISIPRDTKVVYNGSTMKINAVFTYGQIDDGNGAEEMVEAVNELCGVEISEYARSTSRAWRSSSTRWAVSISTFPRATRGGGLAS